MAISVGMRGNSMRAGARIMPHAGRGVLREKRCRGPDVERTRGDLVVFEGFLRSADVRIAGAHDHVEERPGDAPVRVLIGSKVMIHVPRKMLAGPHRIEMRALVDAVIAPRAVPDCRREERRDW